MNTKHTPGPWSYDGHGINSVAESHKGDRIFKTCLDYSHGSPDRERAIADSNLVAAAPKLLQALEDLRKEIHAAHILNVKKHFSLMVADAAAGTAIYEATGGRTNGLKEVDHEPAT